MAYQIKKPRAIFGPEGYCTSPGYVTGYRLDDQTKEFLDKEEFACPQYQSLPPYITLVPPPEPKEHVAYCWDGSKWNSVEDYRGTVVYDESNGNPFVVKKLGPLPDGYTQVAPPPIKSGETLKWDGKDWIVTPAPDNDQARQIYLNITYAMQQMAPMRLIPSEEMAEYCTALFNIINPPASAKIKGVTLKLPQEPFPLTDLLIPTSKWWVKIKNGEN